MSRNTMYLYNRIWAAVNEVASRLTPTEFGRLAQVLLALSFQGMGFSINHFQQVGRPDFIAEKATRKYAIEVKAPSGDTVMVKREDLMGVENLGHLPLLAVLTFPDLDAQWLVLPSGSISPHAYQKATLKKYVIPELSREVNESFLDVLNSNRFLISKGASELRELIKDATEA